MIFNLKSRLLRFVMWSIIALLIILGVIYFTNQGIKSNVFGFQKLNIDSIDNIVINKFNINKLDHSVESKMLTQVQIMSFVKKWNNSYPVGPLKFRPSYILVVNLKSGKNRSFRTTNNVIKENSDAGFKLICDDNFFERTWNN